MLQKVHCSLIKEEIIRFLLLHIKALKLYLQNYYIPSQNREVETKRSDLDAYPWIELDYPRRNMTDEQILEKYIDLSSSDLNTEERVTSAKLISFGILSKNNITHTSPVIFVARKGTEKTCSRLQIIRY